MSFRSCDDFATKAIHSGQDPEQWSSMAVIPPLCLSTVYKQNAPDKKQDYLYTRFDNPTRKCLEASLAALEGGKYALAFNSGSAAIATITFLLRPGDHVICSDDLYGGTNTYFKSLGPRLDIEASFVDTTKIDNIKAATRRNTRMIYLESPTNPLMKITDLNAVSHFTRSHGGLLTVLDNTLMSPYFQRPLQSGFDIVVHSVTKYINGHSDVLMGAIMVNCKVLYERLRFLQKYLGNVASPFDCFLANRGLKTLQIRMEKHMENGLAVAKYLDGHPMIKRVIHPGLTSHPQHQLAKKQFSGYSGMVSVMIKNGCPAARTFVSHLRLFILTVSLGGVESLVEIPASMSHASTEGEKTDEPTVDEGLVRLSVGLESSEDLIGDIEHALLAVQRQFR